MKSRTKAILSAISIAGALVSSNASATTNLFDPSVSTTTILDGSSVRLDGTLHDTNSNTNPWIIQVYSTAGQCLRLFVSSTSFDSKLVVIAPNGQVYRDDDAGGSLRPLVKIASAPVSGWYTVQVAHTFGFPVNNNFTLLYGRYTAGNINCVGGTGALGISSGAAATLETEAKDPLDFGPETQPRPNSPGGEVK